MSNIRYEQGLEDARVSCSSEAAGVQTQIDALTPEHEAIITEAEQSVRDERQKLHHKLFESEGMRHQVSKARIEGFKELAGLWTVV